MPDGYRTFVTPPGPVTMGSLDDSEPMTLRTFTVRMPQWATDEMIYKIASAITRWRYAHTNPTELVVWIPRGWLTESELAQGHGTGPGSLLGVPMLYGPVPEVVVGVRVERG